MSDIKTATVEALTAEVRVLMVGSRQITLSVFAQLDWLDIEDIEPFGRVRPRDAIDGWTYLVGKNPATGELMRAKAPTTQSAIGRYVGRAEYQHQWQEYERAAREAEREEQGAEKMAAQYDRWAADGHWSGNHDYASKAADQRETAAAQRERASDMKAAMAKSQQAFADDMRPYTELAERIGALPLIVLAGLR